MTLRRAVIRSMSLAETQLRLRLMQRALSSAQLIGSQPLVFPLQNRCALEGYNLPDIMASTLINVQNGTGNQWQP